MAKFCGKCGTKLDEVTGLCPNCDTVKIEESSVQKKPPERTEQNQEAVQKAGEPLSKKEEKKKRKADRKAAKKATKKEQWAKLTFGQKVRKYLAKLLIKIVLIALLGCVIVGGLFYFDIIDIPLVDIFIASFGVNVDKEGSVDEYKVDAPDAESYYEKNSNIIAEINVSDSNAVLTENEAYVELTGRGFGNYPITTEYTMDGQYSDVTDISDTSTTKHPMYQTYYMSTNGEFWTIFVINGNLMANPVSYNLQSTREVQVLVSESETLMSYDSVTGKFFETIPNETTLCLIVVDSVDAGTLDNLTVGEIDGYE